MRKEQKTVALICLAAMLVMCLVPWLAIWHTHYQVVSPLVPESVVDKIVRPYRIAGLVMPVIAAILFFFYLKKKYTIVIAGAIAVAVAWKVYLTIV